ncbi:MAG: prepilin peptidase [Firmicutes bacterium]|nr:prepilin peptidase [Bacillota bacterium]
MLILFIFGLVLGSFLNVLIYRIPRGESIVLPPSHCPSCDHRLGFFDLFPVLSYLGLRGRCRYCKTPISWRYPLVELITGGLTLLCWIRFGPSSDGLMALILTYALIVIAFIDFEHQLIPNVLTLPMMVIGLLFRIYQGEIIAGILGGLIGGGLLLIITLLYPKGMGMGDVKFLAMAGVFLGWEKALFVLFNGSFLGVIVIVPLMLLKKIDRKTAFPFGPFLVVGTLIALYWEEIVYRIYGFYGL